MSHTPLPSSGLSDHIEGIPGTPTHRLLEDRLELIKTADPAMPVSTRPLQQHIPFWYPGNPETAGRYGMNLMWTGPISPEAYQGYVDNGEEHEGDRIRFDGPDSQPQVASSVLVAIAEKEEDAKAVGRRGSTAWSAGPSPVTGSTTR